MPASLDRLQEPTIYVTYGPLPFGDIIAADLQGGSFDINPGELLTRKESNVLALHALGYTALQASEISGISYSSVVSAHNRTHKKINHPSPSNPALTIVHAVEQEIIKVRRPVTEPSDMSPRYMNTLAGLSKGQTSQEIAEQVGATTDDVKQSATHLYKRLGVSNKASATMLRMMMRPSTTDIRLIDTESGDSPRVDIEFNGGHYTFSNSELFDDEIKAFMMHMVGYPPADSAVLLSDPTTVVDETEVINLLQGVATIYGERDIIAAFHSACANGHVTLQRECTTPPLTLTETEKIIWNFMSRGIPTGVAAQNLGIMKKTVRNNMYVITRKLGVRSRAAAALRHHMTYPLAAMLPSDSTYPIRQQGGIVLPNPRTYKK